MVRVLGTLTPLVTAPFDDPDEALYGEKPARKETRITEAAATPGAGASVMRTTTLSPPEAERIAAGVLTWEMTYDLRVRYGDAAEPVASTTLAASSAAGATVVKLASVAGMVAGGSLTIVTGTTAETRAISAVGTAGSGGTGVTVTAGFTSAHTSGNVAAIYTWGPWSSYSTFKVSQPPTVTGLTPTGTVANPTLVYSWNYGSTGGKAQKTYRVRVFDATSATVWDSMVRTGTVTVIRQPAGILAHATTYTWSVTVTDTDGLETTSSSATFTTAFTTPTAVLGFVATPDAPVVDLSWTGADPYLYEYQVERRDRSGQWVAAGTSSVVYTGIILTLDAGLTLDSGLFLDTSTGGAVVDREARFGLNEYRVRQYNGWTVSAPVEASTTLAPDGWWHVSPEEGEFTFRLDTVLKGVTTEEPLQQTFLEPLPGDGEVARPIVLTGLLQGARVSLPMYVRDSADVDRLRSASVTLPFSIIKSPDGRVWRMRIGSIATSDDGGGYLRFPLPLTEIE